MLPAYISIHASVQDQYLDLFHQALRYMLQFRINSLTLPTTFQQLEPIHSTYEAVKKHFHYIKFTLQELIDKSQQIIIIQNLSKQLSCIPCQKYWCSGEHRFVKFVVVMEISLLGQLQETDSFALECYLIYISYCFHHLQVQRKFRHNHNNEDVATQKEQESQKKIEALTLSLYTHSLIFKASYYTKKVRSRNNYIKQHQLQKGTTSLP